MEAPSYRPLASSVGEIRLLVVEPAQSHGDPIVCQLQPCFLDDNPEFEALSYVWGTKGTGGTILIDGKVHGIFENAEAALRRLRRTRQRRIIWIDAICINQADIQERQAQVLLMGRIYRQASQVCVWLGEESAGSRMGMKALGGSVLRAVFTTSSAEKSIMADALNIPFWDTVTSVSRLQNGYDSVINEPSLSEVCELLNRPWWTRAWIMQECVLASRIVLLCGGDIVDWETIEKSMKQSFQGRVGARGVKQLYGVVLNPGNKVTVGDAYQELARLRQERLTQTSNDANLLEILYNFRHLSVTDPRDRIYAFLGLAPGVLSISPSYQSSVSDAYTDFAINMIQQTGSLDVLNCVREWKTVETPDKPSAAYSRFDQARYFDLAGYVVDSPTSKVRYGWVRLPFGWERVWDSDPNDARYLNHLTGETQDTSPVSGGTYLVEPLAQHRICSRGWTKTWDNLGRSQLSFSPDAPDSPSRRDPVQDALRSELSSIPSWVPVWATATHADPLPLFEPASPGSQIPNYCASGPEQASARVVDKGLLALEGSLFDVVVEAGTPWHPVTNAPPISRRRSSVLKSWEEVALRVEEHQTCPYADSLGGRAEALWRTYIADHVGPQSATADVGRLMCCWYDEANWSEDVDGLFRTFDNATSLTDTTGSENSSQSGHQAKVAQRKGRPSRVSLIWRKSQIVRKSHNCYKEAVMREDGQAGFFNQNTGRWRRGHFSRGYKEAIQRIYHACAHRVLFRTRKGYMGLMPWNAETGDEVWVLKGGKTPFLLRPAERGNEKVYKLVGEAYVHGIMGGEVHEWIEAAETRSLLLI